MSKHTQAPAKADSLNGPISDNFGFERHAAIVQAAKAQGTVSGDSEAPPDRINAAYLTTIIDGLFEIAAPHMTVSELESLATVGESEPHLRRIAGLAEGLGCLIENDINTGSFSDPASVANLLFMLSSYAEQGESLMQLQQAANHALYTRQLDSKNKTRRAA